MKLLIVGSVAIDSIETPFGKVEQALGGAATYASIAASYFTRAGIVAVVGGDFDSQHIELLKKRNIDLKGLQIDKTQQTFHWSGYYEGDLNQAHTRATLLNVFESFQPIIPESYRSAPHVLLGNIHPSLQLDVLKQVKKPRLTLCDTMNYWISSEPELVGEVFRKVDIICINDAEALQFCKTSSIVNAAAKLLEYGPRYVIIKKGVHGALLFGEGSYFALPSMPLTTVKDPTGAGDSFAGGVLGYLAGQNRLTENSFRRALAAGTVMASYCVEDFSVGRTSELTSAEINHRVGLLKKYTHLPAFKLD